MDRRLWPLLAIAVLLVSAATYVYVSRGYEYTARFPYDWRYYVDVNLPAYSTDHPVVHLQIPAAQLVREGKLRPDCSDLRFTSTDSASTVYPWAYSPNLKPLMFRFDAEGALRGDNDSSFSDVYHITPYYDGNVVVQYSFGPNMRKFVRVEVRDLNTGQKIYDRGVVAGYYQHIIPVSAGHSYDVIVTLHDSYHVNPVRKGYSKTTPYFSVSVDIHHDLPSYFGSRASYVVNGGVFFVPDVQSRLCERSDTLDVFVEVPPGTRTLRMWYGAYPPGADVNSTVVPFYDLAREQRFSSLSFGNINFSSCWRDRFCGADTVCSGGRSGTWGIFRYSLSIQGAGDDSYRGIYCHGKRWWWYSYHACTNALSGTSIVSGSVGYGRGRCCSEYKGTGASVRLSSGKYYYSLYAPSLSVRASYCYRVHMPGVSAVRSFDMNDYVFECMDGNCFAKVVYYGVTRNIDAYANTGSTYVASIGWYFLCDVCGPVSASITFSPYVSQYYLDRTDIVSASVDLNRAVNFTVPPSAVLNLPSKIYWGRPVSVSVDGNYDHFSFDINAPVIDSPSDTPVDASVSVHTYTTSPFSLIFARPGVYSYVLAVRNEYNTPAFIEGNVSVLPRDLVLHYDVPQGYVHEPFAFTVTVKDNFGVPVPGVSLSPVDANCSACVTASDGTCQVTCTDGSYGVHTYDFNVVAPSEYYQSEIVPVEVNVLRYPVQLTPVGVGTTDDNRLYISGKLWDVYHDAPVRAVPIHVRIYFGSCSDAPWLSSSPLADYNAYTFPDGTFRIYVTAYASGKYCADVSFEGTCDYAPAKGFLLDFSAQQLQSSEENAPAEANASREVVVVSSSSASPVVAEVPVPITSYALHTGSLSAIPVPVTTLGGVAALVLVVLFLVLH